MVRDVTKNSIPKLSQHERRVVRLGLLRGETRGAIAKTLGRTAHTIGSYVRAFDLEGPEQPMENQYLSLRAALDLMTGQLSSGVSPNAANQLSLAITRLSREIRAIEEHRHRLATRRQTEAAPIEATDEAGEPPLDLVTLKNPKTGEDMHVPRDWELEVRGDQLRTIGRDQPDHPFDAPQNQNTDDPLYRTRAAKPAPTGHRSAKPLPHMAFHGRARGGQDQVRRGMDLTDGATGTDQTHRIGGPDPIGCARGDDRGRERFEEPEPFGRAPPL